MKQHQTATSDTVSTPDASGPDVMRQNTIELIIIHDAVYTGWGAQHDTTTVASGVDTMWQRKHGECEEKWTRKNRRFKCEWTEQFWVSEWLIPSLWNTRVGSHWVNNFNVPQVCFNLFSRSEVYNNNNNNKSKHFGPNMVSGLWLSIVGRIWPPVKTNWGTLPYNNAKKVIIVTTIQCDKNDAISMCACPVSSSCIPSSL